MKLSLRLNSTTFFFFQRQYYNNSWNPLADRGGKKLKIGRIGSCSLVGDVKYWVMAESPSY